MGRSYRTRMWLSYAKLCDEFFDEFRTDEKSFRASIPEEQDLELQPIVRPLHMLWQERANLLKAGSTVNPWQGLTYDDWPMHLLTENLRRPGGLQILGLILRTIPWERRLLADSGVPESPLGSFFQLQLLETKDRLATAESYQYYAFLCLLMNEGKGMVDVQPTRLSDKNHYDPPNKDSSPEDQNLFKVAKGMIEPKNMIPHYGDAIITPYPKRARYPLQNCLRIVFNQAEGRWLTIDPHSDEPGSIWIY